MANDLKAVVVAQDKAIERWLRLYSVTGLV